MKFDAADHNGRVGKEIDMPEDTKIEEGVNVLEVPAKTGEETPGTPPVEKPPTEEKTVPIAALKDERKKRQALERLAADNAQQAAYYRGLAEGANKGTQKPEVPANQKPVAPKKPDLNDFTDIDQFDRAKDDYETKKDEYIKELAKFEIRQEYQTVEQSRRESQTREETIGKYRERLATASITDEELPGIANIIGGLMPPRMQEVIISSEAAPKILRFFYENKAELERIRRMPEINLIKEMGKIEERLLNPSRTEIKKKSDTPPPAEEHLGKGDAALEPDVDKMSMKEYTAYRRKQKIAGKG
jgi:hypothetical protein